MLHEFNPTGSHDINVKAALQFWVNSDPLTSTGECILGLNENGSVEIVFHNDFVHGPTTLYHLVRNYLVLKGFVYEMQAGTNRFPNEIAYILLDIEEDKVKHITVQKWTTL